MISVLSVAALLLVALFFPSGGKMASVVSPGRILGKAKDVIVLTPDESVQIPFLAEMERLTEISFYLLHFPEEEEGDFLLAVRDAEGQVLFEAKKPLAEMPHEDFGRIPVGITLEPEKDYYCEVSHSGTSPEPGIRLVVMDESPSWFRAGAIRNGNEEIQDAVLMNIMFFRPRILYLLIAKVCIMAALAVCIVFLTVRLCRGVDA